MREIGGRFRNDFMAVMQSEGKEVRLVIALVAFVGM